MSDPVPAISEAAATGEIAAVFADIRLVLGVDVVNLIWRHLATLPGALPWAWGTLRPLYVDGTITAEAEALHDDLDLPRLPAFPPEVLVSAGLLGDDLAAIRDVLAAYDRTNAMALVALSALLNRLDDEPAAAEVPSPTRGEGMPHAPQPAIPLPALLNMADLPAASADLVVMLNQLGTRRKDAILASMYRHLAHWPAYLALAWTLVAPLDADGRLDRAIADAIAKARLRAGRVVARLHSPAAAPPPAGMGAAIRAAVEPFTGDVIAKMVVVCAVLRAASSR